MITYDPQSGRLLRPSGVDAPVHGNGNGYLYARFQGRNQAVHRIAWFLMTGHWPVEVDHRNGDRADNRWSNLREATRSQNEANKPLRRDSTSGLKGVSWHKCKGRWRAHITVQGKHISLGYHDTPESAHTAYLAAAQAHFGEFARSS